MDKFQAAFETLYFLSSIDGEVSKSEINVIVNFLNANQGKIEFDPAKVIQSIDLMTANGKFDELRRAALVFKETSSAQDRLVLLDFAFDLIASDGKIADKEQELFFILGNTWDIDMPGYLRSKK